MALIQARVDEDTKARVADLARRQGLNESDLLRGAIARLLAADDPAAARPADAATRRVGRRVTVRLWTDEFAAVEQRAAREARSVPAWIAALVRRHALDAVPFNADELQPLREAIVALGPLGRNLNTAIRHWHEGGRLDPAVVDIEGLQARVAALRAEVVALADRAGRRFDPSRSRDHA